MNVQIKHNTVDITQYVIEYSIQQKICSGVGSLELILSGNFQTALDTWNEVEIYEEGSLVGTYSITSVFYNNPEYSILIEAQDDSKRLADYFIADTHESADLTDNKYWIELFLAEAGVTYQFQTGLVPNTIGANTTMGQLTAFEQITQLLQMSGWYMYFDANNVCQIGKIQADMTNPSDSFSEGGTILSVTVTRSDSFLRNRALVWGTGKEEGWVYADVRRATPWNYSESDSRTAVVSVPNMPTVEEAQQLAYKMLAEWAKLSFVKEVSISGGRTVVLGDAVYISSNAYTGTGIVTTIKTSMTGQGHTTTLTLDEKCPRLFALYYPFPGWYGPNNWVYAGTWGGGIKRKLINDSTLWYTYNTGLSDLFIKDLASQSGVLACVTETGKAYVSKEINGSWTGVSLPEGVKARACTIDKDTNRVRFVVDAGPDNNVIDIYASGFTARPGMGSVTDVTAAGYIVQTIPISGYSRGTYKDVIIDGVLIEGGEVAGGKLSKIFGIEIDNDGFNDYISVVGRIGL